MVRSLHGIRKRGLRRRLHFQLLELRLPLAEDAFNAQPSFTAVDPTAVLEDSGPQTINGFATFDPGSVDESNQNVLAYFVSNLSNPSFFATAPSLSTDGDLTFEAALDAFGTSTFELVVQDDGGTAGGGNDISEAQTFTITITGINDAPSFVIGDEVTVNEDSGARTVTEFASNFNPGPGEDGSSSASQVIHEEGADGTTDPLSTDNMNPTDVGTLAHGSNIVRGYIEAAQSVGDVDVFTFTIDPGFQLERLFVLEYEYITPPNPNERNAFLGIDDTDSFPYNANELDFNSNPFLDETLFIGGTVFGLNDLAGAGGGDILPRAGVITGSGFAPPLTAGTYTIYIQQTGPANIYSLDFQVSEVARQSVLAYTIGNLSDPSLFDIAPSIDVHGDLTFTPSPTAAGSVTFDVSVQDDGGVANAGQDTSAAMPATITIKAAPVIEISPSGPNGALDPDDLPRGPQPTSWMLQRSDLRQIVIHLSTPISAPSANDLVLTNLGVNAPVDADQVVPLSDSQLELSSNGMELRINLSANQLADGVYQIELLSGITGAATFTITGDETNKFYVLRGDWNGSGGVNMQDFATFAYWFGNTLPTAPDYVDTNHSGGVNIQDFSSFAANFGKNVTFPAGTPSAAVGGEAELIAAIHTLQNPNDVDGDGRVTSDDAVSVIEELGDGASGRIVDWSNYDVDRNGVVTPLDALRVINGLAEHAALGEERSSEAIVDQAIDELFIAETDNDDRDRREIAATLIDSDDLEKILS